MAVEWSPSELLEKAEETLESARVMLNHNYTRGACNRAYYAIFDAARAALRTRQLGARVKTHAGIARLFSLNFVKNGPLSSDLGRMFRVTEEARYEADYLD